MRSFEFCIPTRSIIVPSSPDWLHEIKYDGYRLRLERDGDRVRLITKGDYNWTDHCPVVCAIADARGITGRLSTNRSETTGIKKAVSKPTTSVSANSQYRMMRLPRLIFRFFWPQIRRSSPEEEKI